MASVIHGVILGLIATIGTDIWAAIVKHVLRLPTANWALVGRWFGHMARGVFSHHRIADSAAIPNELAIGWAAHYVIGIAYGLAYLSIVQLYLSSTPTIMSALVFGVATLGAPWLIMQPCMGAGILASKTPRPVITRLVNLSMHLVFGISLYVGWLLI